MAVRSFLPLTPERWANFEEVFGPRVSRAGVIEVARPSASRTLMERPW